MDDMYTTLVSAVGNYVVPQGTNAINQTVSSTPAVITTSTTTILLIVGGIAVVAYLAFSK